MNLRDALYDHGLSQVEFARMVGVTPRAVAMWLAGQRKVPGPVKAYLRLFGAVPLDYQHEEFMTHGRRMQL